MCKCAHTILNITDLANKIRKKNNLSPLPYLYVIKGWHDLVDNYQGKRNPYHADMKIGQNYLFSQFKANKIAKKLSEIKYKGKSNSFGYCYWWKSAA